MAEPDAWTGYAAATYEVFAKSGTFVLRPGEVSRELATLLAASKSESAAFITAANPGAQRLDEDKNDARARALRRRCASLGYDVIPGRGGSAGWGWEDSLLVLGITVAEAQRMGRDFGQDAILATDKDCCVRLLACAGQEEDFHQTEDFQMTRDPFEIAYDLFPAREIPFLERAKSIARRTRPYEGLKIVQNIPVTMEVLHKTHALLLGGADLTITCPSFMDPKPEALSVLAAAGVPVLQQTNLTDDFDIVLDCAAELLGRITPRIGAVELTGTGTNLYAEAGELNYPVISVDQSRVKVLEALFGTGDAFQRAFFELTGENLNDRAVLLFGYGKVGQGIAYALRPLGCDITVVDTQGDALALARSHGHEALRADDRAEVEKAASSAFVVVTATGRPGIISERYRPAPFLKADYLANMGGEDEFGPAFETASIMVDKKPINFAIAHPTQIRFLDPIFYAHNLGIDLLRSFDFTKGLHAFPSFLAEQILQEWESLFDIDVETVLPGNVCPTDTATQIGRVADAETGP